MLEYLSVYPFAFWLVMALLIGGGISAARHIHDGSGIPMLTVLATVGAWYVGDAVYNDYANNHVKIFEPAVLVSAWWQVGWFLVAFLALAPYVHGWANARYVDRGSGVLKLFKHGLSQALFQAQLTLLLKGTIAIWLILAVIAALRLQGQIPYYFFPFLGYKAEPWGRGRIGSGFDALLSAAYHLQVLAAASFGVVAALATNRRTRLYALVFCLLAWPYFIFDRTRNTMLAAVMPGVLSWGLLRIQGSLLKKAAVLGACFLVINAWLAFVIANRTTTSIGAAVREKGFSRMREKAHHEGLNMYEELCWISTFIDRGSYKPNWGARYLGEALNVIPRSLWPGKPLLGIDYSILRGQGGGDAMGANIWASISTGLIGQGVVNFGRLLGPAFAALLMALWVSILARLDLRIQELGRMPLFACGLILTFNLGRDITLLVLYPFVFGAVLVWWFQRFYGPAQHRLKGNVIDHRQSLTKNQAGLAGGRSRSLSRRRFLLREKTKFYDGRGPNLLTS